MAFRDFMQGRQAQRAAEQTQQQKPESYKEAKTREAAQDKAALKPIDRLPEQPKADLEKVKARMEKASQHLNQNGQKPAPSQADGTNSTPAAERQMMSAQDKNAPPLSPTSAQLGKTANEQNKPSPAQDAPSKSQEKPKEQPRQTIARTRASWER